MARKGFESKQAKELSSKDGGDGEEEEEEDFYSIPLKQRKRLHKEVEIFINFSIQCFTNSTIHAASKYITFYPLLITTLVS